MAKSIGRALAMADSPDTLQLDAESTPLTPPTPHALPPLHVHDAIGIVGHPARRPPICADSGRTLTVDRTPRLASQRSSRRVPVQTCRFCLADEENTSRLVRPCKCTAPVHRGCLVRWRRHRGAGSMRSLRGVQVAVDHPAFGAPASAGCGRCRRSLTSRPRRAC